MYLFIINPRSGGGAGQRAWLSVEKLLIERKVPYESLFTHSADEAEQLVAERDRKSVV